jgi:large subunit ribosomal protein L6
VKFGDLKIMSRIGKKPISIPQGVEVKIDGNEITVRGPKGSLEFNTRSEMKVQMENRSVTVKNIGKTKQAPAIWGTTTRIIANMIKGVTEGYLKQLELNGVGYRMNVQGKKIVLALGFSHPVEVLIPEGIEVKIENNVITISGIDKQKVGQFAADIKDLKPVEPYKGKGFRYVGEVVKKKVGKKVVATA